MKKHVFSLMMVLALVVLAGTSAFAQNTSSNRQIMVVGSSYDFDVTLDANTTAEWLVYYESGTPGEATGTDVVGYARGTGASYTVTWAESAQLGNYYIQITETRDADGGLGGGDVGANCGVTVRRYYVGVYDFDMEVLISDNGGTKITGAANLAACGEGTVANYGDEGGAAFSNAINTSGDLSTFVGTTTRTTRYVSISLTWSGSVTTPPVVGSISVDLAVSTDAGTDFISIDGVAAASLPANDHVIATGQAAGGNFTVTIPLIFNDRWGTDFTTTVTGDDIHLFSSVDGTGTAIGIEPTAKEDVQGGTYLPNTTEEQIILAAPATSTIVPTQN